MANLAGPTKDRLFPLVKVQAWPREKTGAGGPVQRSVDQVAEAFGDRPLALELGFPRADLDTPWADRGRQELLALRNPADGFAEWYNFVGSNPHAVPTVIWNDDPVLLQGQISRLSSLGRGLVFRFRRSQSWNIAQLASLYSVDFSREHVLLVFDFEQISPREDLTSAGLSAQGVILSIKAMLVARSTSFVFAGSSFPSQFAEIDPAHAVIEMRERILFEMLRTSPPMIAAGINLQYGDHASVYAAERPPAFRGAPRVDYPTGSGWIFYRCKQGFQLAASRVRDDSRWNDQLLCWGAQRIRTAAIGNMAGLNSQTPWVAIRINIHMHIQAHLGDDPSAPIEETWHD